MAKQGKDNIGLNEEVGSESDQYNIKISLCGMEVVKNGKQVKENHNEARLSSKYNIVEDHTEVEDSYDDVR